MPLLREQLQMAQQAVEHVDQLWEEERKRNGTLQEGLKWEEQSHDATVVQLVACRTHVQALEAELVVVRTRSEQDRQQENRVYPSWTSS